jgi:hypothetical protein
MSGPRLDHHPRPPVFAFLRDLPQEREDFLWLEPSEGGRESELRRALASLGDRAGVPRRALWTLRVAHATLRARFSDVVAAESDERDGDDADMAWILEGRFLALIARAKLELVDLEAAYHASVAPGVERAGRSDIRAAFAIEKANLLMGRGLYREALRLLPEPEPTPPLPQHWALRASIVAGLSHQALGSYGAAGTELERQEDALTSMPLAVLRLGVSRRRVSLLIESERLDEANDAFEAALPPALAAGSATAKALLLDDGMRLRILHGREEEARALGLAQAEVLASGGVPRTFLIGTESRCSLALVDGPADVASRLILDEAWKAGSRGVFGAQCVAQMLLARALLASGGAAAAAPAALSAVSLADRYSYGHDRVRALTLLAAIRAADGDAAEARAASARALALARDTGLRLHVSLLTLWRVLALNVDALATLDGLLADPGEPAAVRALARATGLNAFESPWFRETATGSAPGASSAPSPSDLPLGDVILALRAGEVVHLAESRALLAWEAGLGLRVRVLKSASARDKLLARLLRRAARGETLPALHKVLWPRVEWRPDRHAKPMHALLAECRAALAPLGLGVRSREGRYVLEPRPGRALRRGDAIRGDASGATVAPRARSPLHAEAIVAHLRAHGPCSGAALARALGVTRQSLHPALVVLRERGILTFEGKGRHSLYALGGAAGDRKAP